MWLKAHLCICKEAERKNRQQKNLNNPVRASGASCPASPRAVTGELSDHDQGETYQIVNGSGSPQIPLQVPAWSYFTQGYGAHYARGENLASPFLFSWVSGYPFCVCVCGGLSVSTWAQSQGSMCPHCQQLERLERVHTVWWAPR